ncbi:2Fe-2S iron-sulfur cluster-binding protein [Thiobacter aerophilum]|uniref:2Fe-2S iron-sulfur cluster-binding protein n=1 Tax=Thiobacter aerophilum TaxID=3121275 RepID=A0ABV0ECZ7_9BURK
MPRLLNLARAARLVGTSRGTLQQKIQAGELQSFDGQVSLEELQRVFPEAALEDNTVLEHVEGIKEKAFGRRVAERTLPPAEVLAARVHEMGKELAESKALLSHSTGVLERLHKLLDEWAVQDGATGEVARRLKSWLHEQMLATPATDDRAWGLLLRDSLLKVMAAQVKVLPTGEEFFVEGGDTILEAALRAGVPLAYGCSSGQCGTCRARVVSGEVKQVRPTEYKLAPAAKAQGEVLLCSTTAVTDVVLEASVAQTPQDVGLQSLRAEVRSVEHPTPQVAVLHLRTPKRNRLRFLAGQRVRLTFGQTLSAELPVASCPCEDRHLEFHVRRVEGYPFADHVFQALSPGQEVGVDGPFGDFVLDRRSTRPVLFLAFCTGFAPIKSLMEHALALENAPAIHLVWIGARAESLYAANLCRAWADALDHVSFTPVIAGGDLEATASRQAQVVPRVLQEALGARPDLAGMDAYVAGPTLAVQTARAWLVARGVGHVVCDEEG